MRSVIVSPIRHVGPRLACRLHGCKAAMAGGSLLALAMGIGSCDLTDPKPTGANPLVSDAHPETDRTGGVSLRRVAGTQAASSTEIEEDFVYVGLVPGEVPAGLTATIRNDRLDGSTVVTLRDGGFDPVPVAAVAGDIVLIDVATSDGPLLSFRRAVPPSRRPRVVRVSPTRGKTNVPVNMNIRVVFSEPVDTMTLTAANVRLTRNGVSVAGTVRLVDSTGLVAAFMPSIALPQFTQHVLNVTTGVRDLQGHALERATAITFTTGDTLLGRPMLMRMSPDSVTMHTRTYQMSAVVTDAFGNELVDEPISWSTNASGGITVSRLGLVTASADGDYEVIATSGIVTASAKVRVRGIGAAPTLRLSPLPPGVR